MFRNVAYLRAPTDDGYLLQLVATFMTFAAVFTAPGLLTEPGGYAMVFLLVLVASALIGGVPLLIGVLIVRRLCARRDSATVHVLATGVAGAVVPPAMLCLLTLPFGTSGESGDLVVLLSPCWLVAGLAAAVGRAAACGTDVSHAGRVIEAQTAS